MTMITTDTATIDLRDLPSLDEALLVLAHRLPAGLFGRVDELRHVRGANREPIDMITVESLGPGENEDCGSGACWCRGDNLYLGRDGACYRAGGRGSWTNWSHAGHMGTTTTMDVTWRRVWITPDEFTAVIAVVSASLESWRARSARANSIASRILRLIAGQ